MKDIIILVFSALVSWIAPIAPVLTVLAVLVCADVATAYMLSRRVRGSQARLSSTKMGKAVRTFAMISLVILLCHAIDTWVCPGNLARLVASFMCFRQVLSILENISSSNGAEWARALQRFIEDKTMRHL